MAVTESTHHAVPRNPETPPDAPNAFLPPIGNTGVETGPAHLSWLQGTHRPEDEQAYAWGQVQTLQGLTGVGTTLDGGDRHWSKGVRADDWSWLVRWGGLAPDNRGLVYVETRQSVWESATDPAALLALLSSTVRASRLDIASDVDVGDRPAALFLRRDAAWTRTRRGSWTLIQRGDGGETLTIGSRTSDRYLRIYVKRGDLIRHELELKRTAATAAADALVAGGAVAPVFRAEYGRIVRWR